MVSRGRGGHDSDFQSVSALCVQMSILWTHYFLKRMMSTVWFQILSAKSPPFTSRTPQLLLISDSHHRPQTTRGLTSGRSGGHVLSLRIFRRTTSRVGSSVPDTAAARAAAPCLRPFAKATASSCMSCHFLTTREALSEPCVDDGDLLCLAPARHDGAEKTL